jgi:hypothetical protein
VGLSCSKGCQCVITRYALVLASASSPTPRGWSWTVSFFSLFSLLFSCPVTPFVVPDALPLFLSSKYSLSFVILTLLFHKVTGRKLLIHHLPWKSTPDPSFWGQNIYLHVVYHLHLRNLWTLWSSSVYQGNPVLSVRTALWGQAFNIHHCLLSKSFPLSGWWCLWGGLQSMIKWTSGPILCSCMWQALSFMLQNSVFITFLTSQCSFYGAF